MTCPHCQKEIPTGFPSCPDCENLSHTNNFIKEQLNNNQQNYNSINNNEFHINTNSNTNIEDPGEQKANLAKIFGILSIFLGPIFAIISLVMVKQYNDIGNGDNYSSVKLAKILSIISFVITVGMFLLGFFVPIILSTMMFSSTDAWMNDTMSSWMSSSSGYPIY